MNIEFIPSSKHVEAVVPTPKSAKHYIPQWYKDIRRDEEKVLNADGTLKYDIAGIKRCMPFLDGLTSGYIQETWTDIYIQKNQDGSVAFFYSTDPQIIDIRPSYSVNLSKAYHPIEFVWKVPWAPKLPNGWSAIFTSPSNRLDLPFISLTAIVDSDLYHHSSPGKGGNYPFYVNSNFEGMIPAGTPMYQIIPFKRENWKSSASKYDEIDSLKRNANLKKHMFNGYKKMFWQKKTYE